MGKRGIKALKVLRIASQTLFFALFVFVFLRSLDPFAIVLNPFLAYDPLIFLTHPRWDPVTVPAVLALLAVSFVFGRLFCGWICPMGSFIEVSDLLLSPLRRLNPVRIPPGPNALVRTPPALAVLAVTAVTGMLAPAVLPFFHPNVWLVRIFSLSGLGIFFLALMAVSSLFARRLWCAYVCPLGALYGLLARISPLRLSILRCSRCGKCALCPMGAASAAAPAATPLRGVADAASAAAPKTAGIIAHQCILCLDYESRCPVEGFSYGRGRSGAADDSPSGRRAFLATSGLLTGGLAASGIGALLHRRLSVAPVMEGTAALFRPPGVVDEERFLRQCLRCLHCVQSCPNRIIVTAGLEGGLGGVFTPRLVFEEAGCEYNCQVCQLVCPNGAIPRQSLEEKKKARIGLAGIDREKCVVYKEGKTCSVCEELCPIPEKAVVFRSERLPVAVGRGDIPQPMVVPQRCTGCGVCQAACPAELKAIVVHRLS